MDLEVGTSVSPPEGQEGTQMPFTATYPPPRGCGCGLLLCFLQCSLWPQPPLLDLSSEGLGFPAPPGPALCGALWCSVSGAKGKEGLMQKSSPSWQGSLGAMELRDGDGAGQGREAR